jgi:hypothetical protein
MLRTWYASGRTQRVVPIWPKGVRWLVDVWNQEEDEVLKWFDDI